jgi:hypothetical protein
LVATEERYGSSSRACPATLSLTIVGNINGLSVCR